MEKVTVEDISLELFKISKNLMLLADVASVVVRDGHHLVEALLELSEEARNAGDDFLEMAA